MFVAEDNPRTVNDGRARLMPIFKELYRPCSNPDSPLEVTLSFDKLIVNDQSYTADTVQNSVAI